MVPRRPARDASVLNIILRSAYLLVRYHASRSCAATSEPDGATEVTPSRLQSSSEHRVVVSSGLRNRLTDIPVLDNLAFFQAEKVNACHPPGLGRSCDQVVGRNKIAFGDNTLDVDP